MPSRSLCSGSAACLLLLLASGGGLLAAAAPLRDAAGNCLLFPGGPWQVDVTNATVHPNSAALIANMGAGTSLHADFFGDDGGSPPILYGIPFQVVNSSADGSIPLGATVFADYPDQSETGAGHPPGRWPFPINAKIEGAYAGCPAANCSGDRHVLVVDSSDCTLYEAWSCGDPPASLQGSWTCSNGAAFNLSNPALPQRPLGWTSSDAAGLPIVPGLVTLAEVRAGAINHAIRFTTQPTVNAWSYPASHRAGYNVKDYPWMGARARLKAAFNCAAMATQAARVICAAMKKYGMILADNGSDWFFQGEASPQWPALWNLDAFHTDIRTMHGSDFEIITTPGESCLCGMNAAGVIDYVDDACNTCTCAQCPPPVNNAVAPPSPPAPSPEPYDPTLTKLVVQTGRSLAALNGSALLYNGTVDAGISSQRNASWNNYNGLTQFWPHQGQYDSPTMTVADNVTAEGGYASRVLLRFSDLHGLLPATANVTAARLLLTFDNWDGGLTAPLQACRMAHDWLGTPPTTDYLHLGWRFTGQLAGGSPVQWSQQGGWGECDPATPMFEGGVKSQVQQVAAALPLSAALVKAWLADGGAQNFGLLLRSPPSNTLTLYLSQHPTAALRPALEITYKTDSGTPVQSSPSPVSPSPSPMPPSPSPTPPSPSPKPPSPSPKPPSPSPNPPSPSPKPPSPSPKPPSPALKPSSPSPKPPSPSPKPPSPSPKPSSPSPKPPSPSPAPVPSPSPTPGGGGGSSYVLRNPDGSCQLLPASHPWHADLSTSNWTLHASSTSIVAAISNGVAGIGMHADFSGNAVVNGQPVYYGIPITRVDTNPAKGAVFPAGAMVFNQYGGESDPGRYPFPLNASIEGAYPGCPPATCGGDRHVLAIDNYTALLYEGYACTAPASNSGAWTCGSGAIFNLSSPAVVQRPLGWTSADAAGLPITVGLIRVAEVKAGLIDHAIRFTSPKAAAAYAFPASHLVALSGQPASAPWMGLRARLRAGFNCTASLTTTAGRTVCTAMKKYGLMLADVGSSWYLGGEASAEWPTVLNSLGGQDAFYTDLKAIKATDMEVVVPSTGFCLCTDSACTMCGAPGSSAKIKSAARASAAAAAGSSPALDTGAEAQLLQPPGGGEGPPLAPASATGEAAAGPGRKLAVWGDHPIRHARRRLSTAL